MSIEPITYKDINWIIDIDIAGKNQAGLQAYLRSLGCNVTELSVTRDWPFLTGLSAKVFPFHGSFEELRRVRKEFSPCVYGLGDSIKRSHYTSYLPKEWFFNSDARLTTWGHFKENTEEYFCGVFDQYPLHSKVLFIRPDSGFKVFTGQIVKYRKTKIQNDLKLIEDFSLVRPETLIWVSDGRKIDREFRCWIVNGRVVDISEYSWDDDKQPLDEIPTDVRNYALDIAQYKWQLDRIYVVDIHAQKIPKKYLTYIMEFNSFSCSGLYNCDSKKLFKAVTDDIIEEWQEI